MTMLVAIFIVLLLMLACLASCMVALFNICDRLSHPFKGDVSEIAELRRTLRDRTVDRNHWMHEAEQWQGMFWQEWNANEYEAAERN